MEFWLRCLVAACVLLVGGCVSMVKIEPVPSQHQTLRYYSGAGLMTSAGRNCKVVFGPLNEVYRESGPYTFFIGVHNQSSVPVLVDPAEISARYLQPVFLSKRWREMRVIDQAARITQLERDRAAAQFSAVLIATTAAVQASQPTTVSGTATGPGGTYTYSGSVTDSAAATAAAQGGASNALIIAGAAREAYSSGIKEAGGYLAKNTVMPGERYDAITGVARSGRQTMAVDEIYFSVNVCDESHDFLIAVSAQ